MTEGEHDPESSSDEPGASESTGTRRIGGVGRAIEGAVRGEALSSASVLDAVGGIVGVVEAAAPGLLYLVIYTFTQDPRLSAIAAGVLVAIAIIARLVRRQPITSAVSGAFGAAVCVAATLFTGRGEDFYLPGFITNSVWSLGLLVSLLIGWPLIGVLYGLVTGTGREWRTQRAVYRVSLWLTVAWLAMFAIRLGVQLPLYFAGRVEALGIARLVMGLPLFALLVVLTWVLLAGLRRSSEAEDHDIVEVPGDDTP